MVASDTSGNITRPPNRAVCAPTGIRPSDPTRSGTATTSACCTGLRCSTSLNFGPSGLSSAHAQKFTANPTVARASITQGRAAAEGTPAREVPGAVPVLSVCFLTAATSCRLPSDPPRRDQCSARSHRRLVTNLLPGTFVLGRAVLRSYPEGPAHRLFGQVSF